MSEENQDPVNEVKEAQDQLDDNENLNDAEPNSVGELPDWAQTMIKELRSEAAERRIALKKKDEESRKLEQERLIEQGKWKELAENRAVELEKTKSYQERAESLESMIRESNKMKLESIPEDMLSFVPTEYSPEKLSSWLDANMSKLTKPIAPKIDGGASGGSSLVSLTDEEKQVARNSNMSLEDYAKYKAKIMGV